MKRKKEMNKDANTKRSIKREKNKFEFDVDN